MLTNTIRAVRGMNDILPEEIPYWHYVEKICFQLMQQYGYEELRTPILEKTELFKRSIGEVTDVVEKEMYTFLDRNEESLTLRPEGTAACVRAGIEHGLFYNQIKRLWYVGSIFRHERPQRGRYRQFTQLGCEAFGISGAYIEAELIQINARLFRNIGIDSQVELQINTLGSKQCRAKYRQVLVDYFKTYYSDLDADSQRRLESNPLRILDSKNPSMQELISQAPLLVNHLDAASMAHFETLQELLTAAQIPFKKVPHLVRGLDYYTDTVFEWVTTELGAQGTLSAGGRFDGLVEQLGGQQTPAVGFAMGFERVIELLKNKLPIAQIKPPLDIYIMTVGEQAQKNSLLLAETLRNAYPHLKILNPLSGGSLKNQLKRADKSEAQLGLIITENEAAADTVTIKFLREAREQVTISGSELVDFLCNA